MQFYDRLANISPPLPGSILTIGNFDGVHCGHRAILSKLKERAKTTLIPSVVLTFDPHPVQVLFPERKLKRLFPVQDVKDVVKTAGINILVIELFDQKLAKMPAERFLMEKVLPHLNPKEIVVGHDFSIGANRDGTLEFLKSWCVKHGIELWVQPPVEVQGERVSSRRIRELVAVGEMERAKDFLGRPFYLEGDVEHGAGRGAGLGIPTINLKMGEFVVPRAGVYVTNTVVSGQNYPSVSNLGVSPTFSSGAELKLETHILNYEKDLYGENVRVEFLKFLRDELKFSSVEDLKKQIHLDIEAATAHFSGVKK